MVSVLDRDSILIRCWYYPRCPLPGQYQFAVSHINESVSYPLSLQLIIPLDYSALERMEICHHCIYYVRLGHGGASQNRTISERKVKPWISLQQGMFLNGLPRVCLLSMHWFFSPVVDRVYFFPFSAIFVSSLWRILSFPLCAHGACRTDSLNHSSAVIAPPPPGILATLFLSLGTDEVAFDAIQNLPAYRIHSSAEPVFFENDHIHVGSMERTPRHMVLFAGALRTNVHIT